MDSFYIFVSRSDSDINLYATNSFVDIQKLYINGCNICDIPLNTFYMLYGNYFCTTGMCGTYTRFLIHVDNNNISILPEYEFIESFSTKKFTIDFKNKKIIYRNKNYDLNDYYIGLDEVEIDSSEKTTGYKKIWNALSKYFPTSDEEEKKIYDKDSGTNFIFTDLPCYDKKNMYTIKTTILKKLYETSNPDIIDIIKDDIFTDDSNKSYIVFNHCDKISDEKIMKYSDILANEPAPDITKLFGEYAKKILNGSVLKIRNKTYRICEIEMYYCGGTHLDKYTHCDILQLEHNKFYPHRFKTGTYKSGTYKCMDIAYGDIKKNIYFGILIRSIENIDTDDFFCGPCVAVNEILSNYGVNEFSDFVSKYNINDEFVLTENKNIKAEDIHIGPRVGLGDKYPFYKDKKYRYAIKIKKIKKQKIFEPME